VCAGVGARGIQSAQDCTGLCSWGWVGELHVVHVAHLFILQVYTSSFGTGWWGEMSCCFSQCDGV
jgi:hypothetical protein